MKVVAVAVCGTLVMPFSAWAASSVSVEGTDYTKAASGNGHGGGTWAWDGANDMTLKDYVGGPISAEGDLNITANGTNTVDSTPTPSDAALVVTNGDLSITGDELMVKAQDVAAMGTSNGDVTITDVTVHVDAQGNDAAAAIVAENGDVNIDGSTIDATLTNNTDSANSAIYASGGSVNIVNGSDVTATTINKGKGTTCAIYATSVPNQDGSAQVNITDSTVKATATGAETAWARGIGAFSNDVGIAPQINITRSNVETSGSGFAALSWSRGGSEVPAGTITITGSTIVSPAGAGIQDIYYDAALGSSDFYGQTIGTGTGTITELDSADIAKSVTIKANAKPSPTPVVTQASATVVSQETNVLPQTGDSTSAATLAVLASVMALLAGTALVARRRMTK